MNNYKQKALEALEQFPENESKQSLKKLLTYAIERKK